MTLLLLSFQAPQWWWLLFVPPFYFILSVAARKRQWKKLQQALGKRCDDLLTQTHPRRRRDCRLLITAALTFLVLSIMEPSWGEERQQPAPAPLDTVFCLDISRSMLARDVTPSRFERAREDVRDAVRSFRQGRWGLVAFAGSARLVCPLTHDRDAFVSLLDDLTMEAVTRGGTNLESALAKAFSTLKSSGSSRGVVVFLSDGEDRVPKAEGAVFEQDAPGSWTVHAVGYGSILGVKIPIPTQNGEVFLKDSEGRDVLTALKPASLKSLAGRYGGQWYERGVQGFRLGQIMKSPGPRGIRISSSDGSTVRDGMYQWPLAFALLLFLLELFWRRGGIRP